MLGDERLTGNESEATRRGRRLSCHGRRVLESQQGGTKEKLKQMRRNRNRGGFVLSKKEKKEEESARYTVVVLPVCRCTCLIGLPSVWHAFRKRW